MRTRSSTHLPLASLLLAFSHLTKRTLGNVTWISPSDGDVYGPGDTLIGEWNSPAAVASPTFRLCLSSSINDGISTRDDEAGCGSHFSPVVEKSARSYLILLGIPNIIEEDGFYLQMEDNYGKTALSPVFSLNPTPSDTYVNPESSPSTTSQIATSTTTSSFLSPTSAQSSDAQSSITESANATPSAVIPSAPRPSQRPQSNAVQGPRLKAAIAVPLSFLAFILLLVCVFSFHLRRHRLANESATDAEQVDLARQSSLISSRSAKSINDVEKAREITPETVLAPTPIFSQNLNEDMRPDVGTSLHQAFLMSPSLRQNPISSLHITPTTVPAGVFRSLTHARTVRTNNTINGPAVPIHLQVSPLNPSPLRKTLAQDEDEDPS